MTAERMRYVWGLGPRLVLLLGLCGGLGLRAAAQNTVRVSGRPVASFAFSPDNIVRLPDNQITIRNTTPYLDSWKYAWSFGDGSTDTTSAYAFDHLLTGLYQALTDTAIMVQLVAGVGSTCPDSARMPLYIKPVKPLAAFGPDAAGCAPLDVTFANASRRSEERRVGKEC